MLQELWILHNGVVYLKGLKHLRRLCWPSVAELNDKASFLCVDCKGDSWNLEDGLSVKIVDAPHTINETEKLNEGAMNEKK